VTAIGNGTACGVIWVQLMIRGAWAVLPFNGTWAYESKISGWGIGSRAWEMVARVGLI